MVLKTIFRLLVAELCGFCLKIFFFYNFTPFTTAKELEKYKQIYRRRAKERIENTDKHC